MMKNETNLYQKLIKRIGRTDSLLIKGFVTVFFPTSFFKTFYGYAVTNAEKFSNIVTISFDCDHIADIKALPELLETLCSYDFKVSFACVGKQIEKYPREHQMIIEDDHEIINHTCTHPFNAELKSLKRFNKLTKNEQRAEIIQCHQICKDVLNYEPVGFRIPHFAVQYTDTVYDILSEIGYVYSSSILAVKTSTFGVPYSVSGILEFPVITCPKHPFQAFDTYHAFRSKITSHKNEEDFFEVFKRLIEFGAKEDRYINMYFDPQEVVKFNNFGKFLEYLKNQKIYVETYRGIAAKWRLRGLTKGIGDKT